MKTLEKIISLVKEVGRAVKEQGFKIATVISLPFVFGYNVNASDIQVYNGSTTSGVSGSSMYIKHIEGASDGYDASYDASYMSGNPNKLHIYSCINDPYWPEDDKLSLDARGANSTTTFNLELYSRVFSGTATNFLRFNPKNSNSLEWKNIFLGGANDSNNIVADIKYIIVSDGRKYADGTPYGDFNLPNVSGNPVRVYDKRKIIIRNHADLNRDRKVNNIDYSIFAKNWGRTGIVKGSDVNDLGAYADITDSYDANGVMVSYGDGVVDYNDLGEFVGEWLWDANDPNTW